MPLTNIQNKKTAHHALSLNQIQIMLISSLIADAVIIYYNTGISFIAHEKIWAAFINCAITLVFSWLFLNKIQFKHNSVIFSLTAFFAFSINAAIVLLSAENFSRFANDMQLSGFLVVALVLIICAYSIKCAEHTIYRTCGVFIIFFMAFAIILFATNANNMHITNLSHAFEGQNGALTALFMSFRFPVGILLFTVIPSEEQVDVKQNIFPAIIIFCALQIIFALTSELIFAKQINEYSQPIFAMAKTASFSVFEHFEPLYYFVFMFALIIKTCVFFMGAYFSIKHLIKKLKKHEQVILVCSIIFSILMVISFVSIYISGVFASVFCFLALICYKIKFYNIKKQK